jgi:hypothetical protein
MLRSAEYVARTGSEKCINVLVGEPKGMATSWKTKAQVGMALKSVLRERGVRM